MGKICPAVADHFLISARVIRKEFQAVVLHENMCLGTSEFNQAEGPRRLRAKVDPLFYSQSITLFPRHLDEDPQVAYQDLCALDERESSIDLCHHIDN